MDAPNLKARRYVAISILVSLSVSSVSQAAEDDELLSILGHPTSTAASGAHARESSELRKVLPSPTPEQNIFLTFFDKGEFEKALFQWPTAFDGTAFGASPTGRALNALLLYRNGMKITGLESLLTIETSAIETASGDKPGSIASTVTQMWVDAAPVTDPTWSLVQVAKWNSQWTEVFGSAAEIRVRARQIYGADQVTPLEELIKKTQVDTPERAWLTWQLVLALSAGDDSGTAAKALATLMKAPQNPVSQDLMTITAARLLYQNGFLDAAIKYDGKVSKSSDYWFDSQEEQGWAFIRKGEPQNTIAITKTLIVPEFSSQIGPEPLFLRSLAELKVCDYPAVVTTLNLFRDRFKARTKDLIAISDGAANKDVETYLARAKTETMTLAKLGSLAKRLPRFITRDEVLAQSVRTQAALEKEAKIAGDLYARSLSGGTAQVGFQGRLEEFRKLVDGRARGSRGVTYSRIQTLASEEVNEISQILQKLHIVEAEILEQVSASNRVADATVNQKVLVKEGTTGSKAKDRLVFPVDQETWFDELANYKVDIKKGCQSAKR